MTTKNQMASKSVLLAALVFFLSGSLAVAADTAREDHEAMRAAFKECADSLGIERPERGQRPQAFSDETKAALDACLKEKGFTPPEHRGPPPGGRRGDRGGGDEQGGEGQQ
ncbi:hypothetical protein D3C72_1932850 [compost metagenome]